jgi:two-component system response regulator (stage 0 sporulation protein F)
MDGIEVLRKIKERWIELPVILCSCYHHYKQDFGTWASDGYIVKSSDLSELKEMIREILER